MPLKSGKALSIGYDPLMKSTNLPLGHSLVETQDGSFTLFSEAFQEACHSTTGAKSETILHYLEGCQVKKKLEVHDHLTILEVGFGLGVGFLTTYEHLPKNKKWHFLSMEIDRNLLEWFRASHENHEFLNNLTWREEEGLSILEAKNDFVTLTILQGDARKTLAEYVSRYPTEWHAIYQDAFSPKRNPVLWTKEWFSLLKKNSHPDVILSTYSASTSIRKSLFETGWGIQKGEKFGPKRTSTRAVLNAPTDPEILLHLERSPTTSISDDKLDEFLKSNT